MGQQLDRYNKGNYLDELVQLFVAAGSGAGAMSSSPETRINSLARCGTIRRRRR